MRNMDSTRACFATANCTRSRHAVVVFWQHADARLCCPFQITSQSCTSMQFFSKQAHAVSTQCTRRCRSKRHACATLAPRPATALRVRQLVSLAEQMQHVAAITAKLAPSCIICVCECHMIRSRTRTLALNSLRKCQTRIAVLLVACWCVIPVGCTPQ